MYNLLATNNNFGTLHFIMLGVCISAIVLLCVFLKNAKLITWFRILMFVGIVSETIKVCFYTVQNEHIYGGYLPKSDLPFQLCSIQLIFIGILNVSKNEKVHRFLLGFMIPTCLVGGSAAMLLPTYSSLNFPLITFQYFMYHSVIVAFAIYLLGNKELDWSVKDLKNTLIFLGLLGFFAFYINSMCYDVVAYDETTETVQFINRINFMYVVDPPASGLPFLNKDHGWIVYIIHYAVLCVVGVSACYIKPIIKAVKEKISSKRLTAQK